MSRTRLTLITGVALLGVYSLIMVATSGTAATYSWVILVAGIVLVVTAARRAASEKGEGRDG